MAEVWEGRDDVLSRPVAVKMLLAHLAADPYIRERFRREAVTAARLVHPGIVAIFDAGVEVIGGTGAGPGTVLSGGWSRDPDVRLEMEWPEQPSTAFMVMELVPGETLRDLISRSGPMQAELTVAIVSQVTDALAHAHAHGLVHRDIKPANVLLRDEGDDLFRVKVADFGIAKAAATTGDLTANGTFLGTPKYVSPEQVQGQEPDPRADLYSLGVVMFEMLAGRPPFHESTDMATALAHVQKPAPALDQYRPDLPPGLSDLVGSLLAKDPDRRVASALALGGALTSVRKRMGAPANEPGANLHMSGARSAPAPARDPLRANVPVSGRSPSAGLPVRTPMAAGGVEANGRGGTVALPDQRQPRPTAPGPVAQGRGKPPTLERRHRTGRVTAAVVLALLVVGAIVALSLFRAKPQARAAAPGAKAAAPTTTLPPPSTYAPVKVLAVKEMTQGGNKPNDDLAGLDNVTSSNKATYWESSIYHGPDFGGYGGLGLVLELGSAHVLHELVVTTTMTDWSAETFVSSTDAPTLSGWGAPTAKRAGINHSVVFSLGGKTGSWVLFWMLDPGPGYQAVVDKVSVRG